MSKITLHVEIDGEHYGVTVYTEPYGDVEPIAQSLATRVYTHLMTHLPKEDA